MNKAILLIFLFLFSANSKVYSQTLRTPVSAAYLGLGAYSNNHIDLFSIQQNQAALARLKQTSAGLFAEKRFLLKELSLYNAAVTLSTNPGNFGLDMRYYGFADYNEMQVGLAYGRSLGNRIDLGLQFNYYGVRVAGYGNASTFNFDIATIAHLTDKLNAGIHAYNPVGGRLGKAEEEKLASLYSFGFGFEASEKFFVGTDIEKEEGRPVNVNAGLQYKFIDQLMARVGIASSTSSVYFGIGVKLKSLVVHATANYHQQLGVSPGVLLIVTLSNKSKAQENNN